MNTVLANESELYFERGGPTYRLMQRIGVIKGKGPSIERRILWFIAVTWVPLFVFAIVDGRALGPTPRESMLLDFATYARFFLAVPLLVLAEVIVGPRLATAGLGFIRGGFVRQEDLSAFSAAVGRVARRREALAPELIMIGIALFGAWYLSVEQWYAGNTSTWKSLALPYGGMSLAGPWHQFVALPFLQFLLLRWLWRLTIWTCFLYEMSRLDLNLIATHADQAGGLGFLGIAHSVLGIFSFGMGAVLSADTAFRIYFEGAPIHSFEVMFISYLVINEILFVGPLLVFVAPLLRTRLQGLSHYGALTNRYNRAFHAKWVKNEPPAEEPLLGTSDIQSLADLGNSFDRVREMRDFPFGGRLIIQIAVMSALPALPLLLLVVPVTDILKILGAAIL
jgi:hypothetical protein